MHRVVRRWLFVTCIGVINLGSSIAIPASADVVTDWNNAVLHARMNIGETELLGADIPTYQPMRSAYLTLIAGSSDEAERFYAALSDGGEIFMPMNETFFAYRFAQLRDKFGASWMILHERPGS